jgi:hypothetical protein
VFAALQSPAVSMPNELTVSHFWRDEKRPREYDFDAVFGPQHTQVRTHLFLQPMWLQRIVDSMPPAAQVKVV